RDLLITTGGALQIQCVVDEDEGHLDELSGLFEGAGALSLPAAGEVAVEAVHSESRDRAVHLDGEMGALDVAGCCGGVLNQRGRVGQRFAGSIVGTACSRGEGDQERARAHEDSAQCHGRIVGVPADALGQDVLAEGALLITPKDRPRWSRRVPNTRPGPPCSALHVPPRRGRLYSTPIPW